MAKLRHIALCSRDPWGTAKFYDKMFGLKVVDVRDTPEGLFIFSSDGVITLAILDYKSEEAARHVRIDPEYVGLHHMGFLDDNPEERVAHVRAENGTVIERPPEPGPYFEYKILDPNGIVVDIARKWPGIDDAEPAREGDAVPTGTEQ
jgi:catechol 2,3-dioxygenase-like lactoylglutathione lyase family enzyme